MKHTALRFLMAIFALVLTGGCVTSADYNLQAERVNQLQIEVRQLKEQVQLKNMEMERQVSQTRTNLPDIQQEMDRLKADLQRLTTSVETTSGGRTMGLREQLIHIRARLDRLESRLRLPPLDPEVVESASSLDSHPPAATEPAIAGPDQQPGPGPAVATGPASEEDAYRAAKEAFDGKRYTDALTQLRAFMSDYPNSSLKANAQFFIGECHYEQREYEEAILAYQQVVKDFPKSDKVSIALLKQAYAFLNIGDKTTATLLLKKIVREHPQSYAAGVAKQKLSSLQ